MRNIFISCLCLLNLSACIQQDVIMAVPADTNVDLHQMSQMVSKHCFSANDTGYLTAKTVVGANMVKPQRADSERMNGCAAVKFQVGADGEAANITILREYPDGYGYGDAVADSIQRSTYAPNNGNGWFFVNEANVYYN